MCMFEIVKKCKIALPAQDQVADERYRIVLWFTVMLAVLQETTSAEKKVEILYSSRGYFSASQVSLDMLCYFKVKNVKSEDLQ